MHVSLNGTETQYVGSRVSTAMDQLWGGEKQFLSTGIPIPSMQNEERDTGFAMSQAAAKASRM